MTKPIDPAAFESGEPASGADDSPDAIPFTAVPLLPRRASETAPRQRAGRSLASRSPHFPAGDTLFALGDQRKARPRHRATGLQMAQEDRGAPDNEY